MLNVGDELLKFVGEIAWIRAIMEASLGIQFDGEVSVMVIFAVVYTHAVILAATWGTLIATTTRVTVGEIDRGTADLLLAMPVSRFTVCCSTTLAWILIATLLSIAPMLGIAIGLLLFETQEPVSVWQFTKVTVNFWCLNLAIGGFSSWIAAISNRRGVAVGVVISIALVSTIINFLIPILEMGNEGQSISGIRYLSLLNYFRPVDVIRSRSWPVGNMVVLLSIASVTWLAGLLYFQRRDIPTA